MFWELVTTIFAGFAGAGIALLIRRLTKKKAPTWLVPAFAGVFMLGVQIQGEYDWYPHQVSLLPKEIVVIKAIQETSPWRPWSYIYPQTVRFSAVDTSNIATSKSHPDWALVNLYFFERRHLAKRVPQVIDCQNSARSNFFKTKEDSTLSWHNLDSNDPLLTTVCSGLKTH